MDKYKKYIEKHGVLPVPQPKSGYLKFPIISTRLLGFYSLYNNPEHIQDKLRHLVEPMSTYVCLSVADIFELDCPLKCS